jgi:hypothetical protein
MMATTTHRLRSATLLRLILIQAVASSERASAGAAALPSGDVAGSSGGLPVLGSMDCIWVNGSARFVIQGARSGVFVYQD